jgi:hypothetical protein
MDGAAPDFIIIGTMKSGTTTLFRWLQESTGSELCKLKEPQFFSQDKMWNRGLDWYQTLFPDDGISGEASPSYTHPDLADTSARRIAETLPDVKLVALLRDPAERLRSHYRHQVQRGRERRDFLDAVSDVDSIYVRQSRYDLVLAPYLEHFTSKRLLVLQSEALFGEDLSSWNRLLEFLAMPRAARPEQAHNVTAAKAPYTALMRSLYDRGITQRLEHVTPRALKRVARPLFINTRDHRYAALSTQSRREQLPAGVRQALNPSGLPRSTTARLDLSLWTDD